MSISSIRHALWPAAAFAIVLAVAAPASAAITWSIVPSVDPSTSSVSFANVLTAISARTTTDAWAVGSYQGPARHDGKVMLTERWNGTAWTQVPTPNVQFFDEKLLAVSAPAANEAWAVGSTNQTSFATTNPIAVHWDGAGWTIVATPATTGSAKSILAGVIDFGRTNAWAVGKSRTGRALIEHWDGGAWSIVTAPDPKAPTGTTLVASTLTAISATSPSDIWAVGTFTVSGTTVDTLTLTEHYNGTAWTVVPSPNVAVRSPFNGAAQVLNGVVAVSPTEAWAVGDTIDTASGSFLPDKTLILHFTNGAWSVVSSPDHAAEEDVLAAATALSSIDVWAVGNFVDRSSGFPISRTLTLHWDGKAWTQVASPNGAGGGDTLLSGTAAVPGTGQVWADGITLAPGIGYRTFVLRTS